jgi:hypothetical protein
MGDLIRREHSSIPDPSIRVQRNADYQWAPDDDDSLDIRRYYQVLLKRKWLIRWWELCFACCVQSPPPRLSVDGPVQARQNHKISFTKTFTLWTRATYLQNFTQTQLRFFRAGLGTPVVDRLNLANDPGSMNRSAMDC